MMVIRDCEALGISSTGSKQSSAASMTERRVLVSELFSQKIPLDDIAARLGVNPMTVRRDLAALKLK
jgi:predicted ArsR family transcriptional regulator